MRLYLPPWRLAPTLNLATCLSNLRVVGGDRLVTSVFGLSGRGKRRLGSGGVQRLSGQGALAYPSTFLGPIYGIPSHP